MSAILLQKRKFTDENGDLWEWVVWKVPTSRFYKEGVRYRLAFIPREMNKPTVLYDNHHPKGHHKHLDEMEFAYQFLNIDQLLIDFETDANLWKKMRGNIQ